MSRLQCTFGKSYLSSLFAFFVWTTVEIVLVEAVAVWESPFGKMFLQLAVLLRTF